MGGRALTSTEIQALRDAGLRNVSRYIWVMPAFDLDYSGYLYEPAAGGGYDSADGYRLEVR
jgi:hypothetical protein